jgi:hypothetical protein
MLAGTAEVSGDRGSSVLGSGQLSVRPLRQLEEITFSQRVRDAAANAQAYTTAPGGNANRNRATPTNGWAAAKRASRRAPRPSLARRRP